MTPRVCLLCRGPASVALGVRARYENTNAVWAPNLDAYLCQSCAEAGCRITIDVAPTYDGLVTTTTRGPRGKQIETALIIGEGRKVTPGQRALL